uniref:Dishevelled-binding antagonist of beta-catenin 1 n=1 Tax=Sphaeramia orbicularis TaxID=375764 RepID=A0A673AWG9_9TELE
MWSGFRCGLGLDVDWVQIWTGFRCGLGSHVDWVQMWSGFTCGLGSHVVWVQMWTQWFFFVQNCLRRPDPGLGSQLQGLDQQINDLRLDDRPSHDPLETDSRPSSGKTRSSTWKSFSPSALSSDELVCCLDCDDLVAGLCEDSSSSSSVRRSLSAPHPSSLDSASSDLQSRFQCDVYCYPSPLHAVAVQSPLLLQVLGHGGWTRVGETASDRGPLNPPVPLVPPVAQNSSWLTQKRLDGYIYNLLQRRPQPIRTSRPRTSIGTDPAKSVLRQASLSARQMSGSGSGFGTSSPLRQRPEEDKNEEQQIQKSNTDLIQSGLKVTCSRTRTIQNQVDMNNTTLKMKRSTRPPPSTTPTKDVREVDGPSASPEDVQPPCLPSEDRTSQPGQKDKGESPGLEPTGPGSSSESQDEAGGGGSHMVNAKSIPTQWQNAKQCGKNVKTKANRMSDPTDMENPGHRSHLRSTSTRIRTSEEQGHVKVSRRASGGSSGRPSSRLKRLPASIPEDQVMDKHNVRSGVSSSHRHHGNHHRHHHHPRRHHHNQDQVAVVAKPKHKCSDYWRLRTVVDVPYDEAFRRARRCQRRENMCLSSPYSYMAGSNSEYSAECASLFHSTVVDTSEDEKSDYTTNCFGDSESSSDGDDVEESATTSNIEERGGAGLMSRGQGQMGGGSRAEVTEQEVTQTKAFVKIKVSHNLKKKILRFRGGSLKLMTTV